MKNTTKSVPPLLPHIYYFPLSSHYPLLPLKKMSPRKWKSGAKPFCEAEKNAVCYFSSCFSNVKVFI
jgi:hypothetical protein